MAALTQTPVSPQDTVFSGLFSLEADPYTSSGIEELQSTLGSILIAEEDTPKKSSSLAPQLPVIENKWTGIFALFSFPRELRDEIYYHYLYRTKNTSSYSRTTSSRWPFHADGEVVSLLLTCNQVYHEVIEVFHRHNEVEISSNIRLGAGPEQVFNSFPNAHAQQLQKCRRQYHDYKPDYLLDKPMRHFAGECLQIMIRDAYFAKSYFPKLRGFTADWTALAEYFDTQEGLSFTGKPEEEKTQLWLEWMRFSTREIKALPPPWMKIELKENHSHRARRTNGSMHQHHSSLNTALAMFSSEVAAEMGLEGDFEIQGDNLATEASKVMSKLELKRRKNNEWNTL